MNTYDRAFYEERQSNVLASARAIVPHIVALLGPRRVVDVGCGTGDWLSVFLEHGVERVVGVDGPWVQRPLLRIRQEQFIEIDLERSVRLDETFDLAMSLEVAEHLSPDRAKSFVADLVSLAPVVLFSAAIPWQGGTGHVNEQWPQYWYDLFLEHGYVAVDCIRWEFWADKKVNWWYAQNMIIYSSRSALEENPALGERHARSPQVPLAVVHPEKYIPVADPEQMSIVSWLKMSRYALKRLKRRLMGDR